MYECVDCCVKFFVCVGDYCDFGCWVVVCVVQCFGFFGELFVQCDYVGYWCVLVVIVVYCMCDVFDECWIGCEIWCVL